MKKRIVLMAAMSIILGATYALTETGYKRSPWGSKSWNGPGTPPHWSTNPPVDNRPVDPGWGVRPPIHTPDRRGRVYYYQKSVPLQTVIIEQEQQPPAYVPYVPAQKQTSPLRCGGRTVTRKDPVTGELIIEYVSSSRACPD